MNLYSFCIILGSVLLTTGAQIALKIASIRYKVDGNSGMLRSLFFQLLDPLMIAATIAYAASFILWIFALRQLPLSIAYSFSGLTIALVTVNSVLMLNETLSFYQISGIILIISGVILLSRF
jgi:multidrug transporter EmrE-like cation transporter